MESVKPTPRLYRSAGDKVIAGVCGGLAQYFSIDPAIVRLAFVVFALAGGASVLLYIVLWIAVPIGTGTPALALGERGHEVLAAVLIAIGALWLLANFGAFTFINWRFAWPLVLIAAGAALLVRRVRP
ncbi:MAG TPA: PspC domain-containing protein [Candidatus Limnocylindria bacterium]|nr:PspC domain-containing protein [Candidatus Limnocylindria bacterium]